MGPGKGLHGYPPEEAIVTSLTLHCGSLNKVLGVNFEQQLMKPVSSFTHEPMGNMGHIEHEK